MTNLIGTIETLPNGRKRIKTKTYCPICDGAIYIYDLPKHLENCPEGMPVYALLYPMPEGESEMK